MSNGASNRSFNSDVPEHEFDRIFREGEGKSALRSEERVVQPHDCEECGHHMKYADQRCGCTSRRP